MCTGDDNRATGSSIYEIQQQVGLKGFCGGEGSEVDYR